MRTLMNNKSVLVLILCTLSTVLSFSQHEEEVFRTPDNWQAEIIPFPLSFAPSIDFVGIEDLRFAPGWSDSTSQEFWTYTFAWYIDKQSAMTEEKLTESFNLYYDGLMGIDKQNQADSLKLNQLDKTFCLFVKTDEGFTGEMKVYDAFYTKDYMTLNIKVRESFCSLTNKQIVLCDISPKSFDHVVWSIFSDVKLEVKCD